MARGDQELEALIRDKLSRPAELNIVDAIALFPSLRWAIQQIDLLRADRDQLRARRDQLEATLHTMRDLLNAGTPCP